MANIARARAAAVDRILGGDGHSSRELRRAAFDQQGVPEPLRPLLEKVAQHAYKVIDEDILAAKAAGTSEDELFEVVVAAAIGQASRQYESALAALAAATKES